MYPNRFLRRVFLPYFFTFRVADRPPRMPLPFKVHLHFKGERIAFKDDKRLAARRKVKI